MAATKKQIREAEAEVERLETKIDELSRKRDKIHSKLMKGHVKLSEAKQRLAELEEVKPLRGSKKRAARAANTNSRVQDADLKRTVAIPGIGGGQRPKWTETEMQLAISEHENGVYTFVELAERYGGSGKYASEVIGDPDYHLPRGRMLEEAMNNAKAKIQAA